ILAGHGYQEAEIPLCAGEQVLLFTDGIVETFSSAAEMFGYERLEAIVARPHATARELIDDVLVEIERFGGGKPMADDRTMLAMRVK
ncbi:MAG: SpoIIE family protein phosphatase, partial [Tepidisphaeraceae bacterium]